jgi:hypothetical protein
MAKYLDKSCESMKKGFHLNMQYKMFSETLGFKIIHVPNHIDKPKLVR